MHLKIDIKSILGYYYQDLKYANKIKSLTNEDFIITPISFNDDVIKTGNGMSIKFIEMNKKTKTVTRKLIFISFSELIEII